jgi:hypothetical protein
VSKQFLYLTNDKLVCLALRGKKLVERETFGVADIPTPEFGQYVRRHARIPTYVVTDLIEEDFRLDTMPHLRGGDQEAVLERKLGQVYRASPFRHALIQGREEEGRRDDKVFLHAVTNPELLKPLLAILDHAGVPLEGVYSSAILSGLLLKELGLVFPHTMLVTIIPDFGLRQTYFRDQQIKFSRLTPIIYDESRSVGQLIAAETSRTWQYLDSLRFFGESDSLEVCMLIHQRDHTMMQEAIRSFPMLRYRFLDVSEIADKFKIAPAPTSSHAEEILCHVYANSRLENHFATKEDRRFATFRRLRIGIFSATAVILLAGAFGGGFNLIQANKISNEIDAKNRQERVLQAEFQMIANSMKSQKMATDTVRDTSIFFNSQVRPAPAVPGPLLKEIADVLEDFPGIQLNQIAWASSNDPALMPQAAAPTSGAVMGTAQLSSTTKLAAGAPNSPAPAGAPATAFDAPLSGNKYHVALVEAGIEPFSGDMRRAIVDIERFVAALQTNPELSVKVVRMPVDTAPAAALKVIDRSAATATQASFAIHIARKVTGT